MKILRSKSVQWMLELIETIILNYLTRKIRSIRKLCAFRIFHKNAYANKIVPEAQGEASKILRESEAYQSQTVAEAEGQATRFVSIYSEYIQAKDVTRQRMFLETMEKVFGSMNKIIVDSESVGGQGVVPYLPLNEINKKGKR